MSKKELPKHFSKANISPEGKYSPIKKK